MKYNYESEFYKITLCDPGLFFQMLLYHD
jgi:hypothetical protein